ncbi:hypothetical protein M8J75_005077 [Diaphorina citri]|nr:hypothetical protein M8J75_005077 [Diaphorina citri]
MIVANIVRSWIGEAYLASCVRTPLGQFNGALKQVSESRLGAIVIDSVLQRSAIDKSSVDQVLIESNENSMHEMLSSAGLPDTKYSIVCGYNGLKSIASAVDLLASGLNVTICGGATIWSQEEHAKCTEIFKKYSCTSKELRQKYLLRSLIKIEEARKNNLFLEEVQPIMIPGHPRLKRRPISLTEDETVTDNTTVDNNSISLTDGAAACVITTKDFISNIKLSPLGKIISFVEASSPELSVKSILEGNKLETSDISLWQIDDITPDAYHQTVNELGIDEALVNVHGGTAVLGYNRGMSGLQNMIHLIHTLKAHQKGIVVYNTPESTMSVLLEKLPVKSNFITSQRKPMLNLFTKDPCPLCDELNLELTPYLDRVHLEEVYLTPESNWYKLYRYEIPVLFLGGRFVCRNRFNAQVFDTLLKNIEKELQ